MNWVYIVRFSLEPFFFIFYIWWGPLGLRPPCPPLNPALYYILTEKIPITLQSYLQKSSSTNDHLDSLKDET